MRGTASKCPARHRRLSQCSRMSEQSRCVCILSGYNVTVRSGSAVYCSALHDGPAYLQVTNLNEFVNVMDDVGRAFGYKTRPLSMTLGEPNRQFLLQS